MSSAAAPQAGTSAAATPATSTPSAALNDKITVGSKAIVCQDADLRGEISLGAETVLHPRCAIVAYAGPIIIGDHCIVEENVIIVNRSTEPMTIGPYNLFEVGCRIEARSIGSYNTFEPKSRVSSSITIGDYCTVGAACTATADQAASEGDFLSLEALLNSDSSKSQEEAMTTIASGSTSTRTATEHLSDYTVVYGSANERRKWSGEGKIQQTALMHKHLAYLSETLPKYSRLKLFT